MRLLLLYLWKPVVQIVKADLQRLVCVVLRYTTVLLTQGWATVLVSGPHVGRRSPSRAGLLDGSSSICSTTIIVRVALIGKQKKKVYALLRCSAFHRNIGEAENFKRGP